MRTAVAALACLALASASEAEAGRRALLVLGSKVERDGSPSAKLTRRLQRAHALAMKDPHALVLVSGGTSGAWSAEGTTMARWLIAQGIAPDRILVENRSRHSGENADYSVPILMREGVDAITVVTERYHLRRAMFHVRSALREANRSEVQVDGTAAPDGLGGTARLARAFSETGKIVRDFGLRARTRRLRAAGVRNLDALMRSAIAAHSFPGAAVVIGRGPNNLVANGFGTYTYESDRPVTTQSKFDLASLTKVVATTTAAMKLYEQGRLDLEAPLSRYLSEYAGTDKAGVTIRQVLTHTGGFGGVPPGGRPTSGDALLRAILERPLASSPGSERYSDLGMIVMGLVIERITGEPLAEYCRQQIFVPLHMGDTSFRPMGTRTTDETVVPTERDPRRGLIRGEVHDEKAYLLGGVAGHAGLFSTADDLARFARMMMSGGMLDGRRFLREETIQAFVGPQPGARRALGWDRPLGEESAGGRRFGPMSFGHTGFTGTSIWIDPEKQVYAILLTNRVYPAREQEGIKRVRPRFADVAYALATGAP